MQTSIGRYHGSEHDSVHEEGACCFKSHGGDFIIPCIRKIRAVVKGQWCDIISRTSEKWMFVDHEGKSALRETRTSVETLAWVKLPDRFEV